MQMTEELATVVWNPVTGCDRISAGCDHCYALALARRLKAWGQQKYQIDGDPRTSGPGFGLAWHRDSLAQPLRWKKPRVVFVSSMGDLFHARVPVDFLREVFAVMAATPQHTYWLLTKRPHRARTIADQLVWSPNVWLGTSVEDESVLRRLDHLRATPAALKMLFCEPLLGPLDHLDLDGIGWVTVAGEAGRKHRPMDPDWARSIRDQAGAAGVPFYFKQWSGVRTRELGRELDGREWNEIPETDAPAFGATGTPVLVATHHARESA